MAEYDDVVKKIKKSLKKQKPEVNKQDQIEINCNTLEEGIKEASTLLGSPREKIEYEIVEEGSKGMLGIGKKPYKIKAWVKQDITQTEEAEEEESNEPVNGDAKIKITKDGVFLRVTPPKNGGEIVAWEKVSEILFRRKISDYDPNLIKTIISDQKGEYEKIGEYIPNPENDAKVDLIPASNKMECYIEIHPPFFNGRIIEAGEIKELLQAEGITKGLMPEKIDEIYEKDLYNKKILIAKGKQPVNGKDSYLEFKFKTNPMEELELLEDEAGRVNYSDLNLVQNVVEDQILAEKMPPTKGEHGYDIYGEELKAEDGVDIPLPLGNNVKPSDDGRSVLAGMQGQAVYNNGFVSVEPIYTVEGDVGVKTGNIVFLGTVVVKGNVEDGYSVKASQNIEIIGSVGKSEIDAEGNVIIRGGFQGHDEGYCHAGQNVFAKFINSARLDVGNDLIVMDGILHSYITAGGRIICNGKKGKIVGGKLLACKEITAKELGSYGANTETKLESGTDPRAKKKLKQLEDEKQTKLATLKKLSTNLDTLKKMKDAHGSLPPEKEIMLDRMLKAQRQYKTQLDEIEEELVEIRRYLNEIITVGKVSAQGNVYPGVEIIIKNVLLKVKNEFQYVTFINDAGSIRPVPFQEIQNLKDDIAKQFGTKQEKNGKSKNMNLSV